MKVKKVCVLGAGAMGSGIAQVCATAGYEVWVRDIKQEFLDRGKAAIEKNLQKAVSKGKMTEEKAKEILSRIHFTLDMEEAVKDADLVIEAVPEIMDLKKQVFAEVQKYAKPECIFASNTSGLSITELGNATDRPEKFLGLHFFNPPPVMALVEVIKGEKTSDETIKFGVEFVKSLGKVPVVVKKDVAGFIVNRILVPYLVLAIDDVEKGVATKEEIDATMMYKYGFPMGPIELSDFVGLDILYHASQQWDIVPQSKLLEEKFKANELGMKTGKGFYDWSAGRPKIPQELAGKYDAIRLIAPMVNIAADLIAMGVADAKDIDTAMKLGTNMPKGPCELGDEIGLDVILAKVEELYKEKGFEILKPSEHLKKMVSEGKLGEKSGEGFYSYGKGEMTFKNIEIEKDTENKIAKLIINRPQRLNALSLDTLDEIFEALRMLEKDDDVRVVVITGAGDKAFSAGFDLQTAMQVPDFLAPANSMMVAAKGQWVFTQIERFPKPVIAAINGYAFGGGCELALACDFRIMKRGAKIGLTEISLALIPGWGGTQRLPKLVGLTKAKEMIMLAKRIDADEAERIGLVNKAVDPEKFEEEVMALAKELAAGPPVSLRAAKYAINFGAELPAEIGQMIEAGMFAVATSTQDVVEGVSAFFQRRKPEFKGK
ncbi:3-hydroxyacyl-CoA dehydrogenase/enoyl-CoA hydratase family protein [Archaeoglobus sp.]|jgi:enoyl-CoA hydratase/3-hydroxyacyl-CoA dehydrogenase|uniref:3-hydroxyacyl-CoA dehydrogenase/enoyl-CoA hydratase family protein n=1 Tax=Archaeoglobus sp. TaxID=1872626 RepID=UPI0024AA0E51|nr:3-hydroxyacyl-CoA dehydrogenase/enoyl-CoA hydratase family protein [Archaeoglobus sp.]MDI3498015.1 enoyl-CoA hydratase / 3-hydroxyacyl-CoA dehydrogenase [Archaeoglobus sp.]